MRTSLALLIAALLLSSSSLPSRAAVDDTGPTDAHRYVAAAPAAALSNELLAKAQPDECFNGVGQPIPPGPPCSQGQAKVNQAYIWSMAKIGPVVWFGTAANVHCVGQAWFLELNSPRLTDGTVCEFGQSAFGQQHGLSADFGDWRPPEIFSYDTATRTLTRRSPTADQRFLRTKGIRFTAIHDNVVLMGGPSLGERVNLFAFRADTGAYLGSTTLNAYNDVRSGVIANGALYIGAGSPIGGAVLRWTGKLKKPFSFEVVARLDNEAANITVHQNRLFVSTWSFPRLVRESALFMSPPLPSKGLRSVHATSWTRVWVPSDYEPDTLNAMTYGGGAMASFDGYLWWGTMHVPGVAARLRSEALGVPFVPGDTIWNNSLRATVMFRGKDFDTQPRIELVYGDSVVMAYSASEGWQPTATRMGAPLRGSSGYGDFFNNYTWTMAVYQGDLYIGTTDWSDPLPTLSATVFGVASSKVTVKAAAAPVPGADLYRIADAGSEAETLDRTGLGNVTNYGVRTMLASDALYVGMANPMNLLTNPNDSKPEGGWELRALRP